MKAKILIIDDEPDVLEMLVLLLQNQGFDVISSNGVKQARNELAKKVPDLILLDWMMPKVTGFEFAKQLSKDEAFKNIPIIMITAKSEEQDKLISYEKAKIDDYIVKPFSNDILIAKIKAVLRRSLNLNDDSVITYKSISMNTATHQLLFKGVEVKIGPTEYKLLKFFISHTNKVYSRDQLLDLVWGQNVFIEDRTVDVHILRLRKILKPYNLDTWLKTVRGVGYKFSKK